MSALLPTRPGSPSLSRSRTTRGCLPKSNIPFLIVSQLRALKNPERSCRFYKIICSICHIILNKMATTEEIAEIESIFNIKELNCFQKESISKFVNGDQDIFINLPTGFGKSIIYQSLPLVYDKVLDFYGQLWPSYHH